MAKIDPDQRAEELYIDFPESAPLDAPRCQVLEIGDLVIVGGALPIADGRLLHSGRLGLSVTVEQGQRAARAALVQALALLRGHLGALKKVRACVRLTGYIAASAEFQDHDQVLIPASQLLGELFGARGRHLATAIGVSSLPRGACVLLELTVKI